jgi:hypothetical protein
MGRWTLFELRLREFLAMDTSQDVFFPPLMR